VIIVGVWSEQNMLIYLNPDLTGRVHEVSIVWTAPDLRKILEKRGTALNLEFSPELKERAISDCHENAGILQKLILGTLDRVGIHEEQKQSTMVEDLVALEHAALFYAEHLNPLYH